MNDIKTIGEAIKHLGDQATAAAAIHQHYDAVYTIAPADYRIQDITAAIEATEAAPRRKRGIIELSSITSFNTFVADQGEADSTYIYASPDTRQLVAVLNDQVKASEATGWRDFRAVYKAELSREFAIWMAHNKKPMEQEEFAIFLEDNLADIAEPSGEVLHQVALTLQAKTEVNFSSHRRLDNGQVQLGYSEAVSATAGGNGEIVIPREFAIGVRLFKGGEGYKVKARLKYRLGAGKIKFWYELDRPENAIEDAFAEYIVLAAANGYTVLTGKP